MSAAKTAPKQEPTLTKREACELLGKSPRSLVNYIKAGRLPIEYVSGATGRQAVFQRADVERLKRELDTPLVKQGALLLGPRLDMYQGVSRRVDTSPIADLAMIFERAREYAQPAPKPWLTLDEAVEYSGLPRTWLLQRARDGWEAAVDVSGRGSNQRWRFNREALGKIEAGK